MIILNILEILANIAFIGFGILIFWEMIFHT